MAIEVIDSTTTRMIWPVFPVIARLGGPAIAWMSYASFKNVGEAETFLKLPPPTSKPCGTGQAGDCLPAYGTVPSVEATWLPYGYLPFHDFIRSFAICAADENTLIDLLRSAHANGAAPADWTTKESPAPRYICTVCPDPIEGSLAEGTSRAKGSDHRE